MRTATKLRVRVKLCDPGKLQTVAPMKLPSLYRPLYLTKNVALQFGTKRNDKFETPWNTERA